MEIQLRSEKRTTILKALQERGTTFPFLCGGMGRCGKCRVRIVSENGKPASRTVLACQTEFEGSIAIELPDRGQEKISAGFAYPEGFMREPLPGKLGLAIDIGTTTVAMLLADLGTGGLLGREARLNPQSSFGADVISRISYASGSPENLSRLQSAIASTLDQMALALCRRCGAEPSNVVRAAVAANTTMLHLLAGADPGPIAVAPFTPAFLGMRTFRGAELGLGGFPDAEVRLIGGVSAYVGADITAGWLATGLLEEKRPAAFLDLGTNGEMGLWTGERLLCCSTAAGPVFEGAGIENGTGSVGGAIDHAGKDGLSTIGGLAPAGICGSGVIDTLALLLDLGKVDETGFMEEDFSFDAYYHLRPASRIVFTPKDVREVQLAKSAVRSGMGTLLSAARMDRDGIGKVYLAGGFGTYLSPSCAERIGLLPRGWASKAEAVGNSALKGALLALGGRPHLDRLEEIRRKAEYLELSGMGLFQELFIENMTFEEES